MSDKDESESPGTNFTPRRLSIALEVGVRDFKTHDFAAVRGDTGKFYYFDKGDLGRSLQGLDSFAEGLRFLLRL